MEDFSVIFAAKLTTLAILLLFVWVLYRKDMVKSVYFPILLFAVFLAELGNLTQTLAANPETVDVGMRLRFLSVPFIPTLWYLCVREFCGLNFRKKYSLPLLLIIPLIFCTLSFTWEHNRLLITEVIYFSGGRPGNPSLIYGPLISIRNFYQYGIDLLGLITLMLHFRAGTPYFRKQMLLFVVSALIPFANTFLYIMPIGGFNVDVTNYALAVFMILFTYCLFRFGIINRTSIIRDNVLHQIHEGVLLFDSNGIYMDANRVARRIFPELEATALGTCISKMAYLPFPPSALTDSQSSETAEFSREKDGFIETFNISMAPVEFRQKTIGYSVVLNNISLLKKALNELEEKSYRDPLTGLFNRGYLFTAGEKWIERFLLSGDPFSAILFDLDHFKKVNDTYGHPFGDFVLKETARICSSQLRQTDIPSRYGGEEFCLLLPGTPREGALLKAQAVRAAIEEHDFQNGGVQMKITASFGVASCDRSLPDDTFASLVQRADERLYEAKKSGRNKVC